MTLDTADPPVPLATCNHMSTDGVGVEVGINPEDPDIHVIDGKGEFLGGGTTGLVELLDSGDVVKSPWTTPSQASECKPEMAIEAMASSTNASSLVIWISPLGNSLGIVAKNGPKVFGINYRVAEYVRIEDLGP